MVQVNDGASFARMKETPMCGFVTKLVVLPSVAVLFAGLKEHLQLLCGWERETVVGILFREVSLG